MSMPADAAELPEDPRGEFPFDVASYFFHLSVAIARYRDAELEKRLRPLRLNVSRYRALNVIARLEPCTMSELARFSAVDRTTMTRVVDQLVADGLVIRTEAPRDRRQVVLVLTDRGRAASAAALREVRVSNQAALAGVPEDTLRAAIRAKRRIVGNLVEDEALAERLLLFSRSPAD
jgi:DNA-binding MarR family transcriptional regulator